MTDDQEIAAVELTRRVLVVFLDSMSDEYQRAGARGMARTLVRLAGHLQASDPGTILVLRESVQAAAHQSQAD